MKRLVTIINETDLSQEHNGVMLCSFDETIKLMPNFQHTLRELEPYLELPREDYSVDIKIHKLMPNEFPAIPNWHYDFTPRDNATGDRVPTEERSPLKMFMWVSGHPSPQFKSGSIVSMDHMTWYSFTMSDIHRAVQSELHTWRAFIRVIPTKFIHAGTQNVGKIRRHSQVYLDAAKFSW